MSGEIGTFGTNDADMRGSACGFPATGHKKKGNAAEGWDLTAGDGRNLSTGSRDTAAPDICGYDTGKIGGVSGPTACF